MRRGTCNPGAPSRTPRNGSPRAPAAKTSSDANAVVIGCLASPWSCGVPRSSTFFLCSHCVGESWTWSHHLIDSSTSRSVARNEVSFDAFARLLHTCRGRVSSRSFRATRNAPTVAPRTQIGMLGRVGLRRRGDQAAESPFCAHRASLNIGVLICIECSGSHRNLGAPDRAVRHCGLRNAADAFAHGCVLVSQPQVFILARSGR